MSDTEFKQRVGTTLRGKWTLDRLIGVGGMAAVYAATHKIGRIDAIKILDPAIAVSPELRARFEQEARAVNSIGHPGAVEVRDIDETEDGTPFLVMELLEGKTVAERIADGGGLAPSELLRIVDELLDVLAAAHDKHIIHRDIKPENLFVLADGRLKVLDFGIARMRDGVRTMAGTMMGTLAYMPPEQIKGLNVDHRSDLFAVGATMFRVLAGRTVHVAENDWMLGSRMLQHPAPALAIIAPAVPEWICWLVDRALRYQPGDRYPDAKTMQQDVRAVRDGRKPPYAAARLHEPATAEPGAGARAIVAAEAASSSPKEPAARDAKAAEAAPQPATRSERPRPAAPAPPPDPAPAHVATKAFPFGVERTRRGLGAGAAAGAEPRGQARPKVPTDKQLPAFAALPSTAPQLPAFVVGGPKRSRVGVPPTQPQMPAFPDAHRAEPQPPEPPAPSRELPPTDPSLPVFPEPQPAAAGPGGEPNVAQDARAAGEAKAADDEPKEADAAQAADAAQTAGEEQAADAAQAADEAKATDRAKAADDEPSDGDDAKDADRQAAGESQPAGEAPADDERASMPTSSEQAVESAEPSSSSARADGDESPEPEQDVESEAVSRASLAGAPERASAPEVVRPRAPQRRLSTRGFVLLLVLVAAVAIGYWAYATGRLAGRWPGVF